MHSYNFTVFIVWTEVDIVKQKVRKENKKK